MDGEKSLFFFWYKIEVFLKFGFPLIVSLKSHFDVRDISICCFFNCQQKQGELHLHDVSKEICGLYVRTCDSGIYVRACDLEIFLRALGDFIFLSGLICGETGLAKF